MPANPDLYPQDFPLDPADVVNVYKDGALISADVNKLDFLGPLVELTETEDGSVEIEFRSTALGAVGISVWDAAAIAYAVSRIRNDDLIDYPNNSQVIAKVRLLFGDAVVINSSKIEAYKAYFGSGVLTDILQDFDGSGGLQSVADGQVAWAVAQVGPVSNAELSAAVLSLFGATVTVSDNAPLTKLKALAGYTGMPLDPGVTTRPKSLTLYEVHILHRATRVINLASGTVNVANLRAGALALDPKILLTDQNIQDYINLFGLVAATADFVLGTGSGDVTTSSYVPLALYDIGPEATLVELNSRLATYPITPVGVVVDSTWYQKLRQLLPNGIRVADDFFPTALTLWEVALIRNTLQPLTNPTNGQILTALQTNYPYVNWTAFQVSEYVRLFGNGKPDFVDGSGTNAANALFVPWALFNLGEGATLTELSAEVTALAGSPLTVTDTTFLRILRRLTRNGVRSNAVLNERVYSSVLSSDYNFASGGDAALPSVGSWSASVDPQLKLTLPAIGRWMIDVWLAVEITTGGTISAYAKVTDGTRNWLVGGADGATTVIHRSFILDDQAFGGTPINLAVQVLRNHADVTSIKLLGSTTGNALMTTLLGSGSTNIKSRIQATRILS